MNGQFEQWIAPMPPLAQCTFYLLVDYLTLFFGSSSFRRVPVFLTAVWQAGREPVEISPKLYLHNGEKFTSSILSSQAKLKGQKICQKRACSLTNKMSIIIPIT